MDYESLKDLFIKSGLEIHWEDPAPEGLLTCFKLIDEETGERLGAAGIVLNQKNEMCSRSMEPVLKLVTAWNCISISIKMF